ncbi:MAG: TetR/AcrR family transcriptional regulator [Ilumatobacteraceae bacterium]|nr:TetR/AcrR family transcriptional regulator [Ilumatobacteraceae bacterium]
MQERGVIPEPAQERAIPTVKAVLDATIQMLEDGGEAAVRLDEVLRVSGISRGSLYHHFGSREGLIEAARLAQFTRSVTEDITVLRRAILESPSKDDLRKRLRLITEAVGSIDRKHQRLFRISILASAYGRPTLERALGEEQKLVTDQISGLVVESQERGWVRRDVDARAVASFIQAYSLGRVLVDIDTDRTSDENWFEVVSIAIEHLLFGK